MSEPTEPRPFTDEELAKLNEGQETIMRGLNQIAETLRATGVEAYGLTIGSTDGPDDETITPMVWTISVPRAIQLAYALGPEFAIVPSDAEQSAEVQQVMNGYIDVSSPTNIIDSLRRLG